MAATHPPEYPRSSRPLASSRETRPSRRQRDLEKREHRAERAFAILFFVVILFTLVYLVLRSPVASLLGHP